MSMTYGDFKIIVETAAHKIGLRDDFQCEVVHGFQPASVEVLTSPLTQLDHDLLWGEIRDLIPIGIAVNIKSVQRKAKG
jgi:hypothetical protein